MSSSDIDMMYWHYCNSLQASFPHKIGSQKVDIVVRFHQAIQKHWLMKTEKWSVITGHWPLFAALWVKITKVNKKSKENLKLEVI